MLILVKMVKYIFLVFLIFLSSNVIAENYGNWLQSSFVDEFGDETEDKFIAISTSDGKFSNSATQNSNLMVSILLAKEHLNRPVMTFYEYGSNPVQGYYTDGHKYTCKMKNSKKELYNIGLYLGKDSQLFVIQEPVEEKFFLSWLEQEEYIKFYCFNNDLKTQEYKFELDMTGFNSSMDLMLN